jgi:hypothetical protein
MQRATVNLSNVLDSLENPLGGRRPRMQAGGLVEQAGEDIKRFLVIIGLLGAVIEVK